MAYTSLANVPRAETLIAIWKAHSVWLVSGAILLTLTVFNSAQAIASAQFAAGALAHTAPYLVLSIAIAAWAGATGADNLIARAFTGAPLLMIFFGALAGGLSPFCSCGVIPAGLGLKKDGASDGAAVGFLISTPQTGVDAILVSASHTAHDSPGGSAQPAPSIRATTGREVS